MSAFSTASAQDLKRLLELFPIAEIRKAWPDAKGTKEEICFGAVESKDYERIAGFVDEYFSCCKQHAYIFNRPEGMEMLPATLQGEPAVVELEGTRSLYI